MMNQPLRMLIRIVFCLVLIVCSFLWATRLMDSVYAYRSPLHDHPPEAGMPLLPAGGKPAAHRLVFVLIDALRVDTSMDPSVMPTLNQLRQEGAWATMHSRPPSFSDPSYSVLLTGAWPDLSDGPALNLEYEDTPTWTQDNLFTAFHRAGYKTALSGYYWFEKLVPQSSVSASFYTELDDRQADAEVMQAAQPWLGDTSYAFTFIHLDQVDYAGHYEGGPRDPRWVQAASRVDTLLAEIVARLDLNRDTLLVVSDHGQIDRGGHGGHEPIVLMEPFVLVGAGIKPGSYGDVDMVDIAPTLAALMGTNIPASSQGRVRLEMLELPPEGVAAIPPALQAQQSQLLEAYQSAIGSRVTVQPGADIVGIHQAALDAARLHRLNGERLPRAALAILAALLPLVWFWRKHRDDLPWYIVAALLYTALFNLTYAVLDGRTYSLSSVASAEDLFLVCGTTGAIALLVSWLVAALGGGILPWPGRFRRQPPAEASLWSLDLTLAVIYSLALPILWSFTLNGIVVTWTLPDFPSMFLGFLSLIQILVVTLVGLVLTGVIALATRLRKA
jgi:hypothetical protein